MQHQAITNRLKSSRRIALPLLLSGTVMMSSACGPQGFGVGRNPLGRGVKEAVQTTTATNTARFDGNPEQLSTLFLRSKTKNILQPGQSLGLEVIALDRDGKRIDPAKLQLEFTSSENKHVTVDANGVLTGLMPFESSQIKVTDKKTGASALIDVTVGPKDYTGNPEALASISLILRQQTVPGKGEQAQYHVVAKDILGNPIDPTRLRLEWSISKPQDFSVDKNGLVTALSATGVADLTVRDTVTGRVASGTVQNIATASSQPTSPTTGNGNIIPTRPDPIPSGPPGVPVNPSGPSQGNNNPLQPPPLSTGTPGAVASIMLTPAVSNLYPGDRVQLNVSLVDKDGKTINPDTVTLQWLSSDSGLPVDSTGVVTANVSERTTRVTVSVPGTGLSASVIVNSLRYLSSGGGGGGGAPSGPVLPVLIFPSVPGTYSTPLSPSSFDVHIVPPATTQAPITRYQVTIGNAPGAPTFYVPAGAGTVTAPVPPESLLAADTTYAYSVLALTADGLPSATVNAFGTTLKVNHAPTNLIGGSKEFSGIIRVSANTAIELNRTNGNALGAGDDSNAETLTVVFQPTHVDFGTVSLNSGYPGTVTVTGTGTQASPLQLQGPKADVNEALNFFKYTPKTGFVGDATVTMTTSDTVEGVVTPDDVDTLIFSIVSAAASPPQNLMNTNPTFAGLITTKGTDITLNALNNSELTANDNNGDELTVTLTPTNGQLNLQSVPAGLTVTGVGSNADPYVLKGRPYLINSALKSGLRFTPTAGFIGTGTILMHTVAVDGTDTDTVNINIVEPSNLFNGNPTFPTTVIGMAKKNLVSDPDTILNGATNRALGVLYPPGVNVRVNLILLDENGNNPGQAVYGSLAAAGTVPGTITVTNPGPNGAASIQLEGPVTDLNTLFTTGIRYTPPVGVRGKFRLRMNSVQMIGNTPSTDANQMDVNNDVLMLEVSEVPVNRFNSSPTLFPPVGTPLELGFNTPLPFTSFANTPLSVIDNDSPSLTVTLTPTSNGKLSRTNLNPIPAGVTVSSGTTTLQSGSTLGIEATNAQPLVIVGSPSQINAFLNNGITFTPTFDYVGTASVEMKTTDGTGTDIDTAYINVLGRPENTRSLGGVPQADFANPGFIKILSNANTEMQVNTGDRRLATRNYAAGSIVEVTLSVPTGTGTLRINGAHTDVTVAGAGTNEVTLRGTQANINNNALSQLFLTPGNVAGPTDLTMTMRSIGSSLGDNDGSDTVVFTVTQPPRNTYKNSETDTDFPASGAPLQIFQNQTLVLNNTATATQPAAAIGVNDDSTNVSVTLTPANTANNTNATIALSSPAVGAATVSNNFDNTGIGTNAHPLVISGPLADVKATMALLQYTPQTGFTGATSLTIASNDGGPVTDTNVVNFNVKITPQNAFNNSSSFPAQANPVLVVAGQANAIKDDVNNSTLHALSVTNLNQYSATDTVTVTLSIPSGTLSIPATTGVTITGTGTGTLNLSATGSTANIAAINTALGNLTYTPAALTGAPAVVELTMTHGPSSDTDILYLFPNRLPINLYNAAGGNVTGNNFPAAGVGNALLVNEGTPLDFSTANNNAISIGSVATPANLTTEDSSSITVTLTPTAGSGTLSLPNGSTGLTTLSGSGTNASPLVLTGSPAIVNTVLAAGLRFSSTVGFNGAATIRIDTNDGSGRDTNDLINLDVRARPANRFNAGTAGATNTFPGTGAPLNVGLNSTFPLNAANNRQLGVNFYINGDTIDVTLRLSNNTRGNITATTTGGAVVSGSGTDVINIHSTGANSVTDLNNALATLVFHSINTGGTVDLEMTSTNGSASDSTVGQDVIRLNIQNQSPINYYAASQTNFPGVGANPVLFVINDNDTIDFGVTDPTASTAAGLNLTGNTPGALTVSDDDSTVTTTVTPPTQGILSLTGATAITPTGAGTNASPYVFVGSPANINLSLAKLRFTPTAGQTVSNANLTITTVDGASQTDTDTVKITIEANNVDLPTGTIFRAVYQLGRDKLPELTVSNLKLSGNQLAAGATIEIVRYNDNGTGAADDSTTVLRTVTLRTPQTGGVTDTMTFNNVTNTGMLVVKFPGDANPLPRNLLDNLGNPTDGQGKIGVRFKDSDNSPTVEPPTTAATYPFSFFVFPERAIYGVEYVRTSDSIFSLVNTNTTTGGNGRLTTLFQSDSSATKSIQNGQNKSGDASVGIAKRPSNGYVYYVREAGTGQLIEWNPALGIDTGAFTTRGNLRITNGPSGFNTGAAVTSYNFNDRPARLGFNSTISGTTKTDTLYAGAGFIHDDNGYGLSGFYRINNYTTNNPTVSNIFLTLDGAVDETAFNNTGDFIFEPDTNTGSAVGDNRFFIAAGTKIYATTSAFNPVEVPASSGNFYVDTTALTVPLSSMQFAGQNPRDFVGLSIDGAWTDISRSILVVARYNTPNAADSRLYRISYTIDGTGKPVLGAATLLAQGDFTGRPLVDITSAHLQ